MKRRKLILVSVGLLALCCLGSVMSAIFFPDADTATETAVIAPTEIVTTLEEPTPTARATARATATQRPTRTTLPTAVPPTSTTAPTNTPPPTAVPASTSAPIAEAIRGLGQDRASWEQDHTLTSQLGIFYDYEDLTYSIIFLNDRIGHLEYQVEQEQAMSLNDARNLASQFIPSDSVFEETYSPPGLPELIVDLYSSQTLADIFEDGAFVGGEVGQFIVIYNMFENETSRIVMALGNNP